MAQQSAEGTVSLEEESADGNQKQKISGICNGDSPWIIRYGKGASFHVLVVRGLVKAVVTVRKDVVHGNVCFDGVSVVCNADTACKIHWSGTSFVIVDVEISQLDLEREVFFLMGRGKRSRRPVADTQMDASLPAVQVSGKGSCQNDEECKMEQERERTFLQFPLEDINGGCNCCRAPCGDE